MKNVSIVISSVGYHWEEVFAAYYEFYRTECNIEIFTVTGAPPKADPFSLKITGPLSLFGFGISSKIAPDTFLGKKLLSSFQTVKPVVDLDPNWTDILYIPGGHGCLFDVNRNEVLHEKIKLLYSYGKTLSAVCHATSTFSFVELDSKSITENKSMTGFSQILDRILIVLGGVDKSFLPLPFSNEVKLSKSSRLGLLSKLMAVFIPWYVQIDRPFVTGTGPKASKLVARAALDIAG